MAVKRDYKVGDKVVFIDTENHEKWPQLYPEVGTVGTVTINGKEDIKVKWKKGSTSNDDTWFADYISVIPAEEYYKKEKEKSDMKKKAMQFKAGDRVRVTKGCDSAKKGMVGTVVGKNYRSYGVRFDRKFYGGHTLGGRCEDGYGHWILPERLELIREDKKDKIVITTDGETTTARLYDGKKVIKAAKAECSPKDGFDFRIGAKIAFDRLVDNEIENPYKYYDGKVVFSEDTGDFKKGVLYAFRSNGSVEDFFGNPVFSGGQKVTHAYNSFDDLEGFYGGIVDEVKR